MPPLILWALGTIGALALAKVIAVAARDANSELDDIRRERAVERPVQALERDPVTGQYQPRNM